ncbi:MAG TPA: hypothetical protein VFQ79_13775 [Bryobacteraceae bacterium]|nr:hypothetical protein [Bryobacteraceae bacterium]
MPVFRVAALIIIAAVWVLPLPAQVSGGSPHAAALLPGLPTAIPAANAGWRRVVYRWDNPRESMPDSVWVSRAVSEGQRSKGKIALGLGLIGGGLALMIANPDVSETFMDSSGRMYKKSVRMRLSGGIIAAGGGFFLWQGLKKN